MGILSTTMFWMKPGSVMMGAVGATVGSGRGCGGERWCFKGGGRVRPQVEVRKRWHVR